MSPLVPTVISPDLIRISLVVLTVVSDAFKLEEHQGY